MLNRNASVAILGFNLITAAKQPASFFPALRRGDSGAIMQSALEMANPAKAIEHVSFARSKSAFLRNRASTLQTELAELAQKGQSRGLINTKSRMDAFRDLAFLPMRFIDGLTATAVWMGEYRSALNKGKTDQQAITQADTLVRNTQSTGDLVNSARLYRSGGWKKAMVAFTTDINMTLGNMVSDYNRNDKTATSLLYSAGMYYMLPAVWMVVMGNFLMGEAYERVGLDEEDEEGIESIPPVLAADFMSQVFGSFPFLNAVITGATYSAMGDNQRAFFAGQVDPVAFTSVSVGSDIGKGDMGAAAEAGAVALGVPGVPLWKKLINLVVGDGDD